MRSRPTRRPAARRQDNNQGVSVVSIIANIVVGLVALVHVYILVLEMFLWDKPAGLRAFGQAKEEAAASRVLAANQGLYNGFLAAGLLWGLSLGASGTGVKLFFLGCVLIAGVFGAITASRRILFVQAIPAAVGLALVLLS
jgi:putative membrane protein